MARNGRAERYRTMRFATGILAFAVAVTAAVAGSAGRADADGATPFADTVCPEAAQYVSAIGRLTRSDPPQKVLDAAHAATNAYETCARRKLADQDVEPGVHYAYTREASFSVVEARALIALNRAADAKVVLENTRRLASDVFDWRRSNGANDSGGGKDTRPSLYHNSAKEILDAVNTMLATLNAPASATPTPAPKP